MSNIHSPTTNDVTTFPLASTIDTCSIWFMLASHTLTRAAKAKNLNFIVSGFVRYESLESYHPAPGTPQHRMQDIFRSLLEKGDQFSQHELNVNDLREVARLNGIKHLGKGELTSIVLAMKMRLGFMTDDKGGKKLARSLSHQIEVRTTPLLLGWLVYTGAMGDSEASNAIKEHDAVHGSNGLKSYLQNCYDSGMHYRLIQPVNA
ncbi:MAG: hypothetical protein HQL07_02060 [Nitrospirae bacterium]|nr:hypothetical protein [Magnetococcales bacterium]